MISGLPVCLPSIDAIQGLRYNGDTIDHLMNMTNIRQVFYDTETTGLDTKSGHRMVEFAGIEYINGEPTGRVFHSFFNPDREVDEEASKVNGLTWDMLRDKPRFRDKAKELVAFIEGAEMIAHNSSFDEGFIQSELERIQYPRTVWEIAGKFVDTLPLSRQILRAEGVKRFKLDHLLDHYGIDRSMREKHDALLDCKLLVPVYQRLISGIDLSRPSLEEDVPRPPVKPVDPALASSLAAIDINPSELKAHDEYLSALAEKEKVQPVSWSAKPSRPRP